MPRFDVPLQDLEAAWKEVDIEDSGLIDEGWYRAEIKDFDVKRKDENSSLYLNWRFQIIDGDFDGQSVWDITSLSSKSVWKLKSLATAANLFLTKDTLISEQANALIGRKIAIQVYHDEWNGTKRAKVSMYASIETGDLSSDTSKLPYHGIPGENDSKEEIPF